MACEVSMFTILLVNYDFIFLSQRNSKTSKKNAFDIYLSLNSGIIWFDFFLSY